MSANTNVIFPLTPNVVSGVLTTTTDAHDGSAGTITICTAGAAGTRIDRVIAVASGTTVATLLRLWLAPTGSTKYLYYEVPIPASTDSETAAGQRVVILLDIAIPVNAIMYAGIGTSIGAGTHARLNITCEAGDY